MRTPVLSGVLRGASLESFPKPLIQPSSPKPERQTISKYKNRSFEILIKEMDENFFLSGVQTNCAMNGQG